MDIKSNWFMLGIVGILLIIIIILGVLYTGQQTDGVSLQQEVDALTDDVNNLTAQLAVSEALKTESEDFLSAYFSGWGVYYAAVDIEDTAWSNYNKADGYYDVGNWYSAVGYFAEASTFFMNARSKYQDAFDLFQDAANITGDSVWINISQQCISMMDNKMKAMVFIRETSELMGDTCDAYLDGKYDTAHDYYDEAQTKYGYYQDQMNVFDDYQASFALILSEYVS
jgi:tetratricopeptide (TPR) repeat protein